jgi:HlyD family secretion protein
VLSLRERARDANVGQDQSWQFAISDSHDRQDQVLAYNQVTLTNDATLLSMASNIHSDPAHKPLPDRRPGPPSSARWLRAVLVIAVVVVIAAAAAMMLDAASSPQLDVKLTYTIKRSDLLVTVMEQGTLESSDNTEVKCGVRGENTVIWVVENGSQVKPGDVLVRLDTLAIEDAINERSKYAHWSQSAADGSKAQVARATLAIDEYKEGRYVSQLMTLEKDLAIAESNLRTAQNMLEHARRMTERGYVSELEVEQQEFAVKQSELTLDVTRTEIDVLKRFSKVMELETLNGNLRAVTATHAANVERAVLDLTRRDQALEEFELCVVKADKSGMVIYPSAAAWKDTPDIAEGATVHKDQILLLMPDLSKMQVKVGIHESVVDRIKPGLKAKVKLPDASLDAQVSSVASVARPAGWWTGNVVKYDTIIQLPSVGSLRPGMSAEVEVIVARHEDVLSIPVAAVLETETAALCWVKTADGVERRVLTLGDSNDVFIVVEAGLKEGDEVVLNPVALIEEAQSEALQTIDQSKTTEADASVAGEETDSQHDPQGEPPPEL